MYYKENKMKIQPGQIIPCGLKWTFTILINKVEFTQTSESFTHAISAKVAMLAYVRALNKSSGATL